MQLIKDHQLQSILLEEHIDELLDQQIVVKLETKSATKQINRVLRSTETFLRDAEQVLRKKLREIDEVTTALAQCNSDREKLEQRKATGFTKYLQACDARLKMKLTL